MATPRFERQSFFQAQPADISAAELARGLSEALSSVSETSLFVAKTFARKERQQHEENQRELESAKLELARQQEQMAKLEAPKQQIKGVEAAKKAKQEGLRGDELLPGLDISSQAYNTGFINAYMSESVMDAKLEFINLVEQYGDDPQQFNQQARAYITGATSGMPDELALKVEGKLNDLFTATSLNVKKDFLVNQRKEQAAVRSNSRESDFDTITNSASTGIDVSTQLKDYNQSVDDDVVSGFITAEQGRVAKEQIKESVAEQQFLYPVRQLLDGEDPIAGIRDAEARLTKLSNQTIPGLTPTQRDTLLGKAQVLINRRKVRLQGQATQDAKELKVALKNYKDAKELGYEVSPEETARVETLAMGDEAAQRELITINQVASFSLASFDDRNASLAHAQTGDLADVDRYKRLLASNAQINKAAQEDVYSLGVKQGLIENVVFNVNDPSTLTTKIQQSEILQDHYGFPGSPFSDTEVSSFIASMPNMTVDDKIALANSLQQAPNVWKQFDKHNAPTFAMAGATGDEAVMRAVFTGQEMYKNKLASKPDRELYMSTFNDYVEGVYGIDDKSAVLQTVLAHYAGTAEDPTVYEQDTFEKSMEAVTGGVIKINGFNLEKPRDVTEDVFEDYIDNINVDTIENFGGVLGKTNAEAIELIQSGRIRNIKSGQYIVEMDTGVLQSRDEPGKPFIFQYDIDIDANQKAFVRNKQREARARFRGQRE